MTFAQEMMDIKSQLDALGHEATIPHETESHITDEGKADDPESHVQWGIENDIMRQNFDRIAEEDAVFVVNLPKNGMDGYIGVSTLLEMGIALYLRKKIFLLHAVPPIAEARWAHEVALMHPLVIEGELKKIV